VSGGPVIALVDGDHEPPAVRAVLDRLERERGLAGVVLCGGEEKLRPGVLEEAARHYGRAVEMPRAPSEALRRLAPDALAVVDLADAPALAAPERLRLAAFALHLGLSYEAPGLRLRPPTYEPIDFAGRKLAVIGTGKRVGKTAVAGHWAGLLRERALRPVLVCVGRGGPERPQLARPGTGVDELLSLSANGAHAASDYLEGATLAGVPSVGCRRVGGGPAGEAAESNVAEAAALAASLDPGVLVIDGSGATVPPVEVDRTACVVGDPAGALDGLGPYRLLRAELVLVRGDEGLAAEVADLCPGRVARFALVSEPAEPLDPGARVALFTTGAEGCDGIEPVVRSRALARRAELARDLERAATERCDVYLTELKAAAIDSVAVRARAEGARVAFLRHRPVGLDSDLDRLLIELADV
jgi:cyclic 2,3-diphosphoglycerate synthase